MEHTATVDLRGREPTALAAGKMHRRTPAPQVGHVWTIATHIEDVTPEEIGRRLEGMGMQPAGN